MSNIDINLNISSDDLKIYLILLSFGSATKNELASWSKKNEEEVTKHLQILENKGFISRFGGIVEKYTPYYPLGDFIEQLANFKSNITQFVSEALETLQEVHNSLNSQETSMIEDLNAYYSTQSEKININGDESKNIINSITEKITQQISTSLVTVQSELSGSLDNSLTLIDNNLNDATNKIESNTEDLLENSGEVFTSTKSTVTNFIVELHSSTDEAIKLFFNEVSDSIETFSQSVPTLVEFFFMESIASIEKLRETTQKSNEIL
jgi:predicted transcriptional regulator